MLSSGETTSLLEESSLWFCKLSKPEIDGVAETTAAVEIVMQMDFIYFLLMIKHFSF